VVSRDRRRDDVRVFVGCQNTGRIRRSDFFRMSEYGQNTAFGFSPDVNIRAKYGVRIYVVCPIYGLNATHIFSTDTEYDARGC